MWCVVSKNNNRIEVEQEKKRARRTVKTKAQYGNSNTYVVGCYRMDVKIPKTDSEFQFVID